MKYILFMIDGAADAPLALLGGKTPLAYAKTPTLDRLSSHGTLGRVRCIPDGTAPGTEGALIEVFGSPTREPGRAYLEAPGFGIDIAPGDQALRANLMTISDGRIASHCAGTVDSVSARTLLQALREDEVLDGMMRDAGLRLMEGDTFRHVWVVAGNEPLPACNPPHEHIGEMADALMPERWKAIMWRMEAVLSAHPVNAERRAKGLFEANMLWPWGGGARVELPQLVERTGLRGGCVAGAAVAKGAARLAGMRVVADAAFTADIHTDWRKKIATSLDVLRDCDALFLHFEAPDECAHAGEGDEKVRGLEMADAMTAMLCDGLSARGEAFRFVAFADHYTYSDGGKHGAPPTPYLLYDSRAEQLNKPARFTETDCADLPVIPGSALWTLLAETE